MVAGDSWESFSLPVYEIKGGSTLFNMNSMGGRWFTSPVQVGWPSLGLTSNLFFLFHSACIGEYYHPPSQFLILFDMLSVLTQQLQKCLPIADCCLCPYCSQLQVPNNPLPL